MKKRIFIGSFIKPEGFEGRYRILKESFDKYVLGRWTPLENIHLTYKFIGDIKEEDIKSIYDTLKSKLNRDIKTEIYLNGLGAFPNLYKPRILYIKVKDKDNFLEDCNRFIEDKLSLLGYPKSEKSFIPHITVMRIKKYRKNKFIDTVKNFKNFSFGVQYSVKINIIESILLPTGAKYKILKL